MKELPNFLFRNVKRCSICGALLPKRSMSRGTIRSQTMMKEQLCHECVFWMNIMKNPNPYYEIINGKCYEVNPEVNSADRNVILGGKGKMRYFVRPNREFIRSNDIWRIGDVPERFRDRFPDTLLEINRQTYETYVNNTKPCLSTLCLDRHFCFRHKTFWDMSEGPFDDIPKNWKPGSECCRYFVNKKKTRSNKPIDQNQLNKK